MAERIFKILSAKWEGEMSKTTLRVNNLPRRFLRFGYRVQTTKSAEASAEAAYPLGERNALLMALLSKVLLRYFLQKVTKPAAVTAKGISIKLPLNRR